ncbi:MAG: glycosyltransferase family 4 protein [Chloroflexi bacterium]|nr:glycosyltransferase family 4 protein [Chloroflexota bacterium]
MKIALLSEKYTPDLGGLAISTDRLARLLSSAGHEVRIFSPTLSLPPSNTRTLRSNGLHITRFGAHKRVDDTLVDWCELVIAEHKREPFDVLHAYFLAPAGFVATYAGKYLNIPSLVSIRGNDIERAPFDPSKFSHGMYALQNAGAVTTNASELARKAKAFFDREIFLIPNGMDAGHFKPMERNEALAASLGIKNDIAVIGFVGELREKKGMTALLSACAQAAKKMPVFLLIVGEVRQGEDQYSFEEFRKAHRQLPMTATGQLPHRDLPAYYSLMDVFVHPSLRDGMPNALLEAMACGKAVVATAAGGVKDVLEDGKNGVLVNVNDADMLTEKTLELLEHPEKRASLGKNARESILNKFTLERELEANLEVYRKLGLQPAKEGSNTDPDVRQVKRAKAGRRSNR